MALTRAQLLSGDIANGAILSNQPQGVRPCGAGITIASNGVISVDSQTIQGVMKLGQTPASAAAAYNGYTWPIGPGTAGQQLTTDGAGLLSWSDSDGIPWTAKGQLIVGTGVGTDTLLNVGTNTAVLMADSGTTSGLIYSNAVTSAMQSPAGTTPQRPNPATAGQFRYNTNTQKFEFSDGTNWQEIASGDPTVNTFVKQTVPTAGSASAIIPSGTTAQQQTLPAPLAGYTRFNTDTALMEVFNGTTWAPVGGAAGLGLVLDGSALKVSLPIASIPPTVGGGVNQAVNGSLYWDDTLGQLFIRYNNGGTPAWVAAAPPGGGGGGSGTVTSVGITGTSGIGVISGSPVTTSGSITLAIDIVTLPVLP